MKKFLKKLLVFLSFPLILLLSLEACFYFSRESNFDQDHLKYAFQGIEDYYVWIDEEFPGPKNLLLGSSSVRYGLNCEKLSHLAGDSISFINLGYDARDPVETYFLLKSLDLSDVNSVFFGLDPWIFARRYYKFRNPYLYLDLNFFQSFRFGREHDFFVLVKRIRAFLKVRFIKEPQDFNWRKNILQGNTGGCGSYKLLTSPINFNEPIDSWFQIQEFGWSGIQFNYLQKIKELCQRQNINFLVFIPPKRSDFSDIYQDQCMDIHNQFVHRLIPILQNTPVFGTFDQLENLGDSVFFAEAYHLNGNGQSLYSEIFYDMIQSEKSNFSVDYEWFNHH